MHRARHQLRDGRVLVIREAVPDDARVVLAYAEDVSRESNFLTFGPGEFELTEAAERDVLHKHQETDNQLYILGLVDDTLIATLSFAAGDRRRLRHSGEFGMSVRKRFWGLGVGSLMVDTLIDWAKGTDIIRKINLRVRTDNRRAIDLYVRKGFVTEGTMRDEICLEGAYFDLHSPHLATALLGP